MIIDVEMIEAIPVIVIEIVAGIHQLLPTGTAG